MTFLFSSAFRNQDSIRRKLDLVKVWGGSGLGIQHDGPCMACVGSSISAGNGKVRGLMAEVEAHEDTLAGVFAEE